MVINIWIFEDIISWEDVVSGVHESIVGIWNMACTVPGFQGKEFSGTENYFDHKGICPMIKNITLA